MIEPTHLTGCVIEPVLKDIGLFSVNAGKIVLGTACQESDCGRLLKQLNNGPAKGIYQSERPAMIDNVAYLCKSGFQRQLLKAKCQHWFIMAIVPNNVDEIHQEITWNLAAATVMCRVHYLRFPEPIPDTLPGQAHMWKLRYNTILGAGTEEEYIASWRRYIGVQPIWV